MSLHLHRAERADTLVRALGEVLASPLPDPFAAEIVAVPTPGVERWISQQLSHRLGTSPDGADGVCAGVEFPSPRRLVRQVLDAVGAVVEDDPWDARRAVWPLLEVIDEARGESWASLLWSYLGDRPGTADARRGRRWSTARHLAGLFERYATFRPEMVRQWDAGLDVDPAGRPLSADRAWQAELWRRLRDALGTPDPTRRLRTALTALAADEVPGLPERVSLFGPTRLDPTHLDVLVALAAHRDVHLWLPNPSPVAWAAVAHRLEDEPPAAGRRRSDDESAGRVHHRLLAYLGRDSRELQLQVATAVRAAGAPAPDDRHHPGDTPPATTLLARLQHDLAADASPTPDARPLLDPADRSVQVHACHGPDRQVEVLREVLVGLLDDDPSLEPRDIVVMCPDIETYAPLIAAAFGLDTDESHAEHPGHRLRVRLADRSLRQLNPVLAVVGRVIALAESRMEVSQLLDLCASPPVAQRFGFDTEDLERLHELVPAAGVRWGLDPAHRARFAMEGFGQNTWAAGLDRLLLGVAMDETDAHFIGTVLPMDDVDSADVDLVGRLAEFVTRVRTLTDACAQSRTLHGWVLLCREMVTLLTAVRSADRWQHSHAYAELARIDEQAGPADVASALSLAEVSALLNEAFRGRASRANFRTGTLTMCTMLPMRSVPHRVVCLLGVDDGVFPRQLRPDGDDLTRTQEWVGDPDPRSEDRQLLLDAVLAAEDTLVVLYSGMDARTGQETPPAVPVGALLDALDLLAQTADGRTVRQALTVRHRLQPFDADNFTPGRLGGPDGFSFDRAALRGVLATQQDRVVARDPYAAPRLDPLPEDRSVELGELVRFFHHPVRALLRQRAGLYLGSPDEPPSEQIPTELAGLESWAVGDRMLSAHLAGVGLDALQAAEWRRGSVPPRAFGQQALATLSGDVAGLAGTATPWLEGPPGRADLAFDLGPVRLSGTVGGLHGDHAVRVVFSRLAAKHRLQAWIELLALTVGEPDRAWRSVVVGRGGQVVLGPVEPGWAGRVLADLVDLQGVGLREPLPFSPNTGYEYAQLRYVGRTHEQSRTIETTWNRERDATWERVYGVGVTLAELMRDPSRPEEERGRLAEASRFGTVARRVFHPLLMCEGA